MELAGYDSAELMSSIKGVITISAVFNLGRLRKNIFTRHFFLIPAFGYDRKIYYEASPLTYAKQKTSFPFLMFNAERDYHLRKDTTEMEQLLNMAGSQVYSIVVPNTGTFLSCHTITMS